MLSTGSGGTRAVVPATPSTGVKASASWDPSVGADASDSSDRPGSVEPSDAAAPRTSRANTSSNDGRASWMEVTVAPWASTPAITAGAIVFESWLRTCSRRGPSRRTSSTSRSVARRSTSIGSDVSISSSCPPNARWRNASGVSNAISRPSAIRATTSHSSASGTYWVVIRSVLPASRSRWSSRQMLRRTSGSMPAVGSSRNTSSGSWTSAHASCSRRRMPPDRSPARRFRASVSSSQSSSARMRARRRNRNSPYRLATKSRFSPTVRSSYSETCWGMKPIRARVSAGSRVGSPPSTSASPLVGRRAPVSSRIAVVLPAPLGPITPTIEPRSIARSTPVSATTSSKVRPTPRRAAMGGAMSGGG